MELLDLIDKKVTEGFAGLNARMDVLNGQVRKHGEEIAVLKHETKKVEGLEVEVKKAVLQQNLCAYNCPWKSQMESTPVDVPIVTTKASNRVQLAKFSIVGFGLGALVLEILPNLIDWLSLLWKK